jgi:hypothetical protein
VALALPFAFRALRNKTPLIRRTPAGESAGVRHPLPTGEGRKQFLGILMPKRTTLEAKRRFLLVLGFSLLIPTGLFSQSPSETVAQIASKAGIAREPFPHLQGTASLTLPTGVPLPPEMTYPQEGSIFAVQLGEENTYWQHQIALTPGLREKLWQPDFASLFRRTSTKASWWKGTTSGTRPRTTIFRMCAHRICSKTNIGRHMLKV